ncbi:dephospho-CoA kinase [Paraclostridium benzoelyticum]|uniref:Dephospho-CoA kinase n=1 Tax=Paraclostridium benzoelyticum TaxID=1629550 RepID=A0A0M3DMT7_9FIRM|nr:dephospho-CoA kinase [Paraclostridium benzoelyticum]KKY02732.1 dephospho-CoA kinase [Paraclostridium benzoelyticum]
MLVIGLTGNIGCGKSSLSKILEQNYFDIIDADLISREIMNNSDLLKKVFATFGDDIKRNDGTLDRKKLGEIVFNDDKKLIKLNSLTHPAIKKEIIKKINNIKLNNKDIAIVDAALLIEGKFLDLVDKLVVITCDENVQLERIIKRDHITKNEAMSRINSQMSQSEKIKFGDYIIDNSGDRNKLIYDASKLITHIKEKWCE